LITICARAHGGRRIQRFLCRACGSRFSEPYSERKPGYSPKVSINDPTFTGDDEELSTNSISEEELNNQLSQSNDRQISGGEPTLVATARAGDVDETKTLLFQYS
jgi:hypothetical protein